MRGPNGEELPDAVLFVCTFNSVRSPMAAAIMRHLFGRGVYVDSVGVRRGELDPLAVEAMEEIGIEYWPTFDPTVVEGSRDQQLDAYRAVRDELERRIQARFEVRPAADT
jgi:protein-tyrosine-phosphatase